MKIKIIFLIFFFFFSADRKRTQKMEQARRIKQREDNIRARAAAKKANKGKRGKPVSILIENIVSIY